MCLSLTDTSLRNAYLDFFTIYYTWFSLKVIIIRTLREGRHPGCGGKGGRAKERNRVPEILGTNPHRILFYWTSVTLGTLASLHVKVTPSSACIVVKGLQEKM